MKRVNTNVTVGSTAGNEELIRCSSAVRPPGMSRMAANGPPGLGGGG